MRKTYHRVWKIFSKFYLHLDIKSDTWEERIVLFTGFLIDCKLKLATVQTYLSALRCVLTEDGHKLNEDLFLMNSLTRACKMKNDSLIVCFQAILHQTHKHFIQISQPYLGKLVPAMLLASYYGLLRAGEITQGPHVILAKNVHITTNKKKLMFLLRSSKTHQELDEP